MGQVTIKIRDRAYRFSCEDGEEARLEALGAYLDGKLSELARQYGKIGDERLLMMAALVVTDELFDARSGEAVRDGPGDDGAARAPKDEQAA